ncbi:uncharacterized protein cubi_00908 [Cryptosporidium ubiquitum]|uniref:Uncharacterized protein n=1 Tax=Cryptosporidium ubiquitum TaxID=857276 RepID=A0A1J4MBC2_9CRYT|nr:uncharacterized protein cubi_00908 [Cryptosporidium ubiquitum]OII70763.1 hypothetical protein cubi_00908 [Cryptosporidium ubiquitum]
MHENDENDLSMFKLNKLPQFPRLTCLNLNLSIEKSEEECEKSEHKESHPKCRKKKSRDALSQNVNSENTIIFQLGSSISKKKCIDAIKKKEEFSEKEMCFSRANKTEDITNTQKSHEELLIVRKNSNIGDIQGIYQRMLLVSMEINESRQTLSEEISSMIAEINHIKENLVDFWIELTLTQAKSMNNHSESNSDAETLLNQALTKQESF